MPFDLEAALSAWRRRYEVDDAFSADDLEELERHVRDHVAALSARGQDQEAAFHEAVRKIGDYDSAALAYRNVFWAKAAAQGRIVHHLAARMAMTRNYLLIAWRTVRRHSGFAAINLAGLAVGLAACLLIGLFVRDELSYDRFHANADRLYRVVNNEQLQSSGALAPALEREVPDVEQAVRFSRRWGEVLVRREDEAYYENQFYFTDPHVFDAFTFPLLRGDPSTALERPFTIVLTQTAAEKYFRDTNPIGRTINIEGLWGAHDFEVTAIAVDVPANAHFQWELLASFSTRYVADYHPENIDSWRHVGDHTYVLLREGASAEAIEAAINRMIVTYREIPTEFASRVSHHIQPITEIHLGPEYGDSFAPTSDPRYLWIFSAVALLILAIACINYTNLATARAAQRAREVGVRKVAGAHRGQLVRQFIAESYLLVLLALVPALVLTAGLLPLFNQLTGKAMGYGQAPALLVGLLAVVAVVGVVAGWYPAFFLSRFRPAIVLKGHLLDCPKGAWLRSGLVVFQFAAAVALIAATLVIQQQLDFVRQQRLGLDKEHVVVIEARGALQGERLSTFQDALRQHAGVVSVASASDPLPLPIDNLGYVRPAGVTADSLQDKIHSMWIGPDFLKTLAIEHVEGENVPKGPRPRDFIPVLINESAAKAWGWDEPLGKTFDGFSPTPRVVGVVRDFNFMSLKENVTPLVLFGLSASRYVYVRIRPEDVPGTLAFLRDQWLAFGPGTPLDYTFLDRRFEALYQADRRLARLFGAFSGLAVFLACLGLVGLAAFSARQRTKEIGIRKVLGATALSIVLLLSGRFARLVLVGVVVAAPAAWLLMNRWLSDFAYRVDLDPLIFIGAGATAIGVALLAVGAQAMRAAQANPAEALRYE